MEETEAMKDLMIQSNGYVCMVEVKRDETMAKVREKILEEFDDDMMPCPDQPTADFFLVVGNIRLSKKQESRRMAWDVIDACGGSSSEHAVTVQLQAKNQPSDTDTTTMARASDKRATTHCQETSGRPLKQQRTDDGTSTVESSKSSEESAAKRDASSAMTLTATTKEASAESQTSTETNTLSFQDTPTTLVSTTNSASPNEEKSPDSMYFTPQAKSARAHESTEDAMSVSSFPAPQEEDIFDTLDEATMKEDQSAVAVVSNETMTMETEDPPVRSTENNEDAILSVTKVIPAPQNPSSKHDAAVTSSRQVLENLKTMLQEPDNAHFCPPMRRNEWANEISQSLKANAPDTIIGVLGNTGVGKSSLLNALLDEASVLPTSGSRGCTAAVVELRFNRALLEPETPQTTVYKGQVEFIALTEWLDELKLLLNECSTHDTNMIYQRTPEEQRQPDAAAAWAKINQVYGRGTMESLQSHPKARAWTRLSTNRRVVDLLTGADGQANTILVQEGQADVNECHLLCSPLSLLRGKLRRTQKKWAGAFRDKINDFVYRKGNGGAPQTWPLIRKVVLHGPWAVLSTGACLVDLPGVRDANAARARVAQTYLQNCNLIAVVAPIQRAVDDGSAKELMGEQFKRRLLMDGQYGNVIFICTQTDSCESTEILRDHADVAQTVPGRYERMVKIQEEIMETTEKVSELMREEEDLKEDLKEVNEAIKELKTDIKDIKEEMDCDHPSNASFDDEVQVDEEEGLAALERSLQERQQTATEILEKLASGPMKAKKAQAASAQTSLETQQRVLKAMAAGIRNEYSTACLQKDFKAGLEELINGNDEDEEKSAAPLPADYELEVHCICANDYLKIQGIKSATDGKAGTFSRAEETNIPSLRESVHRATARLRESFATNVVQSTSDMLDRLKLLATQDKDESDSGQRFRKSFDHETYALDEMLEPIVSTFIRKAESKVNAALKPSLASGAKLGCNSAMSTVTSWGSKSRRTKHHRSPNANGLHYSTYNACVRRSGVYTSATAGAIDFNQELCDPMEKEFSGDWQRIMDGSLASFLREAEVSVTQAFTKIAQEIVNALAKAGMDHTRLQTMANTANRTCATAIRVGFQGMQKIATDSQRDLNRSLLPKVTEQMTGGYQATESVPGGAGKFMRMKVAMESHSQGVVQTMFSEATQDLLVAISALIKQLATKIMAMSHTITKSLASVYSVCWDDQRSQSLPVDTKTQEEIRCCRNRLLPVLVGYRNDMDTVMDSVGIEHDEVEFDIVGVESWEQKMAKQMEKAEGQGNLIELLDSDDDDLNLKPPAAGATVRVKAEPGTKVSAFDQHPAAPNPSLVVHEQLQPSQPLREVVESAPSTTIVGPDSSYMQSSLKGEALQHVFSTPGELGICIQESNGRHLITQIADDSQLKDLVVVGDVIVGVNSKDVRSVRVTEVRAMLFRTAHMVCKLDILRAPAPGSRSDGKDNTPRFDS